LAPDHILDLAILDRLERFGGNFADCALGARLFDGSGRSRLPT
jgi:hypothetical protein